MNTIVCLIRHGDIENPRKVFYAGCLDLPLSQKGKDQAVALANIFQKQGIKPDIIASSSMDRATKFAKEIGNIFGIFDIQIDSRLNDNRIPLFAGLTSEEKEAKFPGKDEYDLILEGHESKEEVLSRVRSAFEEIVSSNRGKTIFIVGHLDPLRFLLFSVIQPDEGKIPHPEELPYLEKSCAWKLMIGDNNKVEYELISLDGEGKAKREGNK